MNKKIKIIDPIAESGFTIYKFAAGDDLSSVADRFHTSAHVIVAANNLTEYPVVGEYLLIEKTEGEKRVVMPKDTFESLCGYDEKKIAEVKRKNRAEYLYVGQRIFV